MLAWVRGRPKRGIQTRVLIAIEDQYRAYREVIAVGLEALRPGTKITAISVDLLEAELARLEPQVVVCSRPEPAGSGVWLAWVELSLNPTRPTKISLGGRRSKSTNHAVETLVAVIDEAEGVSRTQSSLEGRIPQGEDPLAAAGS